MLKRKQSPVLSWDIRSTWTEARPKRPGTSTCSSGSFLRQLEKEFPGIPVSLEDERFTSVLAHRVMVDGGMKAKDRRDKKSVDRISAAIILQGWLDRESGAVFAVNPDAVPESLSRNVTRNKKKRK